MIFFVKSLTEVSGVQFSNIFFFLFEFQGRLYVLVDVSQMNDSGSKEAFVSLLEYAEEVLECSDVIVCFQKCQSSNTKTAIRNFLFLGFQPLAPGHEYLPTNPNLVNTIFFPGRSCEILNFCSVQTDAKASFGVSLVKDSYRYGRSLKI